MSLLAEHFNCQNPECPNKGERMPHSEEYSNILQTVWKCANPDCDCYLRVRSP